jgi:hypothetical protein
MDGEETEGTATYKAIGDGLWLISDFKDTMAGQPFEGHGIDGYDPAKGKYVSIWVDSWTPQPLTLEGTYDKASHKLTMMGSGPGMDGQTVKYRMVTHYENDDRFTFTMFLTDASGQENQMLTIVYSRKN